MKTKGKGSPGKRPAAKVSQFKTKQGKGVPTIVKSVGGDRADQGDDDSFSSFLDSDDDGTGWPTVPQLTTGKGPIKKPLKGVPKKATSKTSADHLLDSSDDEPGPKMIKRTTAKKPDLSKQFATSPRPKLPTKEAFKNLAKPPPSPRIESPVPTPRKSQPQRLAVKKESASPPTKDTGVLTEPKKDTGAPPAPKKDIRPLEGTSERLQTQASLTEPAQITSPEPSEAPKKKDSISLDSIKSSKSRPSGRVSDPRVSKKTVSPRRPRGPPSVSKSIVSKIPDIKELDTAVEAKGVFPIVNDLLAAWRATVPPSPTGQGDFRLVKSEPVLKALRARLFNRVPDESPVEEVDFIKSTMNPAPESVAAVKEVLPTILAGTDFVKSEGVKLVHYLLRFADKDPSVVSLMSELYEYYGDLSLSYQWAFLAWAISPSSFTAARVQSVADAVLSSVPLPSSPIRLRALQSPYVVPLPDSQKALEQLEKGVWVWKDKPVHLETLPPFRTLASKDLCPGDLVLKEAALAVAPTFDAKGAQPLAGGSLCAHCLGQLSLMDYGYTCPLMPRTCPFRFCSFDCFMTHSQLHAFECQFLHAQLYPLAHETGFEAGFIVLVVRLFLKAHIMRLASSQLADPADPLFVISSFKSYESETRRLRPELYDAVRKLSRALCHFFPVAKMLFMSPEDCDDMIIRIHTHVLPVVYDISASVLQGRLQTDQHRGYCLGSDLTQVLHSCVPNCHVVYDAETRQVSMYATARIKQGAPLSYSLIYDLYTPVSRRKNLFASWKVLECTCERCQDPSEGKRFPEGLRCRSCIFGIRCPQRHKRVNLICQRDRLHPDVALGTDMPPLEDRDWECSDCGPLNKTESTHCNQLMATWVSRYENIINVYYNKPENRNNVDPLKLRIQLFILFTETAKLAHPNNYVLYNLAIKMSASFRKDPNKSCLKSLEYLRLALMAARGVLPPIAPDLAVLWQMLGRLQFECLMSLKGHTPVAKHVSKSLTVRGPLLRSTLLAACLYGKTSAQWKQAFRTYKNYLQWANHNDPCSLKGYRPGRRKIKALQNASVKLWPSKGVPAVAEVERCIEEDPTQWWFEACRSGEKWILKAHLYGCSDHIRSLWISATDFSVGFNCLGVAIKHHRLDVLKYLLQFASLDNLMKRDENGLTLIGLICSMRNSILDIHKADMMEARMLICIIDKVRQLLANAASQENQWAVYKQQVKSSYRILSIAQTPTDAYCGSFDPIHYAAVRNKYACLHELTRVGVSVNSTNRELATPLHLAALCGHYELCSKLLRKGAHLDAPNYRGETPLMLASFDLHINTIKCLVEAGADLYAKSDITGITCLHAVASGVTRSFRVAFNGRQHRNDPLEGHVAGFNPYSLHVLYEIEDNLDATYATTPVIEALHEDLVLFPDELKRRVLTAVSIVEYIRSQASFHQDAELSFFGHSCREGFTAAEFLLHQWETLQEVRESLLSAGRNVRLMNCSYTDKVKYLEDWLYDISVSVYHLAQIMKPFKHDEPTSLQLRKLTALGSRSVDDMITDAQLEATAMESLLHQQPRQWDAKERILKTDADLVEEQLAKVKEETLREAALAKEKQLQEAVKAAKEKAAAIKKELAEKVAAEKAAVKGDTKKAVAQSKPNAPTAKTPTAKPPGAKPSGAKPSGAKPPTAKPSGAKPPTVKKKT
eukprot:Blabericola_migrator_1__9962@NODE_550_length_7654_cov_145_973903_g415_i0_p1_GENE_NODE_550_length_7654_cov_145_973903_g415_i0NODE_550_length_7654_cov_145_973903_g415_i0_p1_ORF_typecomplete_len1672_score314_54Ank_2/PF12796_7/2_1Ank_2/PF12796_7/2e10Ank_2/PF12796_7/1_7e17Ank_4/PF13637_6/1_4Ank_4/PF13637_6/2_6e08Ank_4/PF13637_6/4_7e11Ank_4/PF13637_6/0_036Ank_5/PF13857_6/13Ank_5/PF13857_6/1_4e03Ank_5/PF13857_6/1e13Ank_5/PF13857_6/1_4e05Ank/PF00023_30/91Ank/PF00023_30/8_2e07Ank/PF00023_30/0_021Ank_3/PF